MHHSFLSDSILHYSRQHLTTIDLVDMKKFSIPCDFNGLKSPFTIYIGFCKPDHHPLHFQADWLSKERGGTIPTEVMESLSKLKELARKNNVSFEDLCVYALGAAQEEQEAQNENTEDATDDAQEEETTEDATDVAQ